MHKQCSKLILSFQVSDKRRLINVAADSSDEDEDSDDEHSAQRRRRNNQYKNSRW